MINVYFIGNLGEDPELKQTQSGHPYVRLRVASNDRAGDQEITTWITVMAYGPTAEAVAGYLKKGARVFVQGSLRQHVYESGGQQHTTYYVVARRIEFINNPNGQRRADQPAAQPARPKSAPQQAKLSQRPRAPQQKHTQPIVAPVDKSLPADDLLFL